MHMWAIAVLSALLLVAQPPPAGAVAAVSRRAFASVPRSRPGSERPQAGRWVLTAASRSCADSCARLGLECDAAAQGTLTTNARMGAAVAEATGGGRSCERFTRKANRAGIPRVRKRKGVTVCQRIKADAVPSCTLKKRGGQSVCRCAGSPPGAVPLTNASFEEGTGGWAGERCTSSVGAYEPSISLSWRREFPASVARCALSTRNAPPDGAEYITIGGGGSCAQSAETIEAGRGYALSVWARGVNDVWGGIGTGRDGVGAASIARVELVAVDPATGEDVRVLASSTRDVGPPVMKGAARADPSCARCGQDDGANVLIDGNYRVHFGNSVLYQPLDADPIRDRWRYANEGLVDGMALAPVATTADRPKGVIATWYRDDGRVWSKMTYHELLGSPPFYSFGGLVGPGEPREDAIVLQNSEDDEDPWAIDAQTYYDAEEDRLWMVWGGHETYVSELDPATGALCCADRCARLCPSTEFDDTIEAHSLLMSFDEIGSEKSVGLGFSGDGCGTAYQEGPALYKFRGSWFVFSSYGSMNEDYTIRVCRSDTTPRGPYFDKSGRECARYEPGGAFGEARAPGSSMLLGPEGEQSVPGHPHIWEEGGQLYMGYDFRKNRATLEDFSEGYDFMAIRRISFVRDAEGAPGWWPTVWTEMTLAVDAADAADAVGSRIGVRLVNAGGADSKVAFDRVSLRTE